MRFLLIICAILLYSCTDYQENWEEQWGNIYAPPANIISNNGETPIIICNEGESTVLTDNGCTSSFICSGNTWIVTNTICDAILPPNQPILSSSAIVKPKSSSSVKIVKSSSSKTVKSSSSKVTTSFVNGVLTDGRDGKTYATTTIGSQIWMAKNLNYQTTNSLCYDNSTTNCTKYGRLYNWDEATKACPTGWHLPTSSEFSELFAAIGGEDVAGYKLKSKSGWADNGNGSDLYKFNALPAGYSYVNGFYYMKEIANFWTSTQEWAGEAYRVSIDIYENVRPGLDQTIFAFSVRCLKD